MITKIKGFAERNKDGFTINPVTLESPIRGFAVASSETQDCFGDEGLEKALAHALENGNYLGGWLDRESNQFYWDSTMVIEGREEAMRIGRENEQIAIFDLGNGKEIRL